MYKDNDYRGQSQPVIKCFIHIRLSLLKFFPLSMRSGADQGFPRGGANPKVGGGATY